jgi:hypothetical protein
LLVKGNIKTAVRRKQFTCWPVATERISRGEWRKEIMAGIALPYARGATEKGK